MTYILRVDIYESKPYPVVRHEFRGMSRDECMRYYQAHMSTDSFLHDCVTSGKWHNVNCRFQHSWHTEK